MAEPKGSYPVFVLVGTWRSLVISTSYSLIAAKSTSFDTMRSSAQTMLAVARETVSHAAFCDSFGVSFDELIGVAESPATTAYGTYLIDIGLRVSFVKYGVSDY